MIIVLFRHGHAIDETPGLGDEGRALSGKGRKATRKIANWLARRGKKLRPVEIWTSPLVRAVQTAEIAAEALELKDEVSVHPELSPDTNPDDLMRKLTEREFGGAGRQDRPEPPNVDQGPGPLLLVGHEPNLSVIAALLLGERSFPGLAKSGVVAIAWEGHGPGKVKAERKPKGDKGG
jgi:phosphohistidine phosphatase